MERLTAYLGLGSNLGLREDNLLRAIDLLRPLVRVHCSSSVYQTAPWGYVEQPIFLNCVLEVTSTLAPHRLLDSVIGLEREMGRQRGARYGPRLIDVDILLYGNLNLDHSDLQIPHPRMHMRAFVLVPLAELAPNLNHPALNCSIAALAQRVNGKEGVTIWGPPLA